MDTTSDSKSKRQIYLIIAIGIIGCVGALWRLLSNRSTTPSSVTPPIVQTNTILEQPITLPSICQKTLDFITCIIGQLPQEEQSTLSLSYQQIISERNILSNDKLLDACTNQYDHLLALPSSYQSFVKNCTTNI